MGVRGEIFSSRVILPNRTYFFNVKENRMGDLYLNIVESKNRENGGFERQSVVLFSDDLQEFLKGFEDSLKVMEKASRGKRQSGKNEKREFVKDREDRGNRESRESREDRGNRENRESREDRGNRENRGSSEDRGNRENRGNRESRERREHIGNRENRENRESRNRHENKDERRERSGKNDRLKFKDKKFNDVKRKDGKRNEHAPKKSRKIVVKRYE